MSSNPKFSDYIAKISPKGKEVLYMGTYFLPVAIANLLTKWITGDLYENWADKLSLLKIEVAKRGIELPEISESFTKNDYLITASQKMNMTERELTTFLWNQYHPSNIWFVISGIGLITIIGLFIYNFIINKNSRK